MLLSQNHRGPDFQATYISDDRIAGFAHNRLKIIDLSDAASQPMHDATRRYSIVFNGEVYNYPEIRQRLSSEFTFRTKSDTEVVLYSFIKWGSACLDEFIGMFAIAIWDDKEKELWVARDRFGVKPVNYAFDNNNFYFASEIKALHAAGIAAKINESTWAEYLGFGMYDHSENTFWKDVYKLLPGHFMILKDGYLSIKEWYSLAAKSGVNYDTRSIEIVSEEYLSLLKESIRLRFRSDVPVGINLSGGLDSSALLSLVDNVQGHDSDIKAFTFITGDPNYDELPWVNEMISNTGHELVPCLLEVKDIPDLAVSVQYYQDEPFGGIPTLAYARLFEEARKKGVIVLLDGQGIDEQWAGYDYYAQTSTSLSSQTIQGTSDRAVLPDCLDPEFLALGASWTPPEYYPDKLRNLQYRDTFYTKIPRALRFNDRVSMRVSTELREPFLDHRLFEIAFRQPPEFKIKDGTGKWFMRQLLKNYLPGKIVEAPKRPLQTPQREWLKGELKDWAIAQIENVVNNTSFFNDEKVYKHWHEFLDGKSNNSFYVWQWISFSLMNFETKRKVLH